jgi:hydroxylamine reductase
MFCFQCEQTAGCKGCTKAGVCGKSADVANGQDELTGALIGLARAAENNGKPGRNAAVLMMQGLFTTITNVNFDIDSVNEITKKVGEETKNLGGAENFAADSLWTGDADIVSLRSTLLLGLRGMAAYAHHAYVLGKEDPEVTDWFFKGMYEAGTDHAVEEWLSLLMPFPAGSVKFGAWFPSWTVISITPDNSYSCP